MEIDAKRYFKLSLPGRSKTAENELRWLLIAAGAALAHQMRGRK